MRDLEAARPDVRGNAPEALPCAGRGLAEVLMACGDDYIFGKPRSRYWSILREIWSGAFQHDGFRSYDRNSPDDLEKDPWPPNPSGRRPARTVGARRHKVSCVLRFRRLSKDASLIRALAETLRGKTEKADALRSALAKALMYPEAKTAFDIFGSELPDDAFAGVFDRSSPGSWREVDL